MIDTIARFARAKDRMIIVSVHNDDIMFTLDLMKFVLICYAGSTTNIDYEKVIVASEKLLSIDYKTLADILFSISWKKIKDIVDIDNINILKMLIKDEHIKSMWNNRNEYILFEIV